jgi:hypothetical protein
MSMCLPQQLDEVCLHKLSEKMGEISSLITTLPFKMPSKNARPSWLPDDTGFLSSPPPSPHSSAPSEEEAPAAAAPTALPPTKLPSGPTTPQFNASRTFVLGRIRSWVRALGHNSGLVGVLGGLSGKELKMPLRDDDRRKLTWEKLAESVCITPNPLIISFCRQISL